MALPLPSFLKSPYIMGSAGVVGVGGVSTVALSVGGGGVDYSENIQQNAISREKLINSLSTAGQLETKCVKEFFGAENTFSFSDSGIVVDDTFHAPERPTVSEPQGDTTGCSYVQFSSKGKEAFIFQTETTVKNDRVGLALFSSGRNVGLSSTYHEETNRKLVSKTDNVIRYYLFFLEKEGENWNIKGGYSWADQKFSSGFNGVTLHLKLPSGNINFNDEWLGIKEGIDYKDDEWKHEMYYGSWKGQKSGSGKEVFEDIELWGNDKVNAEILGKDYSKTFVETKVHKGYEDKWDVGYVAKYEYKVTGNNNRWHMRSKLKSQPSQDVKWYVETLDNWYAPFKEVKGTWAEKPIPSSK